MAEGAWGDDLSDRDWFCDHTGEEPAPIVSARGRTGEDNGADPPSQAAGDRDGRVVLEGRVGLRDLGFGRERPHELDAPAGENSSEASGRDINLGAKRAAVWLGSGVLAAAVAIVGALVMLGGGPDPVAPPRHRATAPAVAAAPTTANLAVPHQDHAVPFTAHTDSCSPEGGSAGQLAPRSPQALTDTATDSAWVCGRGPQESLLDGQILHVQFGCDASHPDSACSYMLTSMSVTPGWVAKTAGGKEEWLQHRVVTRLQFNFFNGNQLVADPLFVDTHSIHGPVPAALPAQILVSRADVIILHTERPPAAPLPTTSGGSRGPDAAGLQPPGGLVDSVLGPAAAEPAAPAPADPLAGATSDAVDATFAMSQMQFFGHSPT